MTDNPTTAPSRVSPDSSLPTVAALAMGTWVLFEFTFRKGVTPLLADPLGSPLGADMVAGLVFLPVVAVLIARLGTRADIHRPDWEYDVSLKAVGAGVAGVVAYFVVYQAALIAFASLVGAQPATGSAGRGNAAAWALGLFALVNGLLVPIVEELAWRGVIQTALTRAYGAAVAVVVTGVAFVLKHLIVDAAVLVGASSLLVFSRIASLIVLSFVLCGLRARYGTASSTVAHIGMNGVATAATVLA